MRKPLVWSLGAILTVVVLIAVWFAGAGIGSSAGTLSVSAEGSHAEKTLDWRDRQAIDAELYFERRARATEEGFIAALPFHR